MYVKKNHDNTYTLTSAHGKAVVDPQKGTMSSDDMSDFTNTMCLIQEGIENCYFDGLPFVRIKETKSTGSGYVLFDFGKYNINNYGADDDVYFPESTLSDIFTDLV